MLLKEVFHFDLDGVLVVVHVGEVGGIIVLRQGTKLILYNEWRCHMNNGLPCAK